VLLRFHKDFKKHNSRLSPKLQAKVAFAIKRFGANPFDATLRNHALAGSMLGKRFIDVTGDYRILFEEYEHYTLVLLLDVGTHSHLYGE